MGRLLHLGAPLYLTGAYFQPCGFSKDSTPNSRRRPGGRKPAGLRRRTCIGGADGARSYPGAAATRSEEHHVRYINKSTRRPCFDIWEHVVVIRCADSLGGARNRSTPCAWWGPFADGNALDTVEPTRGPPGAVLDRELLSSREENRILLLHDGPVLLWASECGSTM